MPAKHRYSIRSVLEVSALTVFASMTLTACSSFSGTSTSAINPVNWLTPYKVDVIQGNFVSKEQIEVLKPGMTRSQVKDVLGTPLVTSIFHADRWDYVFTLKRQGVQPQSYRYTVFFKGDQLERFEGDTMPSEAEFISKLDNSRKLGKVPTLVATEEQLKNAEKTGVAKASSTEMMPSGSQTAPSNTVYPPLESAKP